MTVPRIIVECGQRFGRLTVVDPETRVYPSWSPYGVRAAICRCDCGGGATAPLRSLANGNTRSCGCLTKERLAGYSRRPEQAARLAELVRSPEGRARRAELRRTHGMCGHPLYFTHVGMVARCENPRNPAYGRYGARGIAVCPEWHDAAVFIAWIEANLGPRPQGMSLDRIDNDLGYHPGNVRWSTASEQALNRRPRRKADTST